MDMRQYRITLTGASALLMHADNLEWSTKMERWTAEPENKRVSKAGDDRTPAWRWLGNLYHDEEYIGLPSDNLMTVLREGGAKVPVPGKKGQTYKRQSQSGIIVNELLWPLFPGRMATTKNDEMLIVYPGPLAAKPLMALQEEKDFARHEAAAVEAGFTLFLKRAKIGMAKHVRVRPRFDYWQASGTVTVFDESISLLVLQGIMDMAGQYCGLGDWRPSSPSKPGPWGRFTTVVKEQS